MMKKNVFMRSDAIPFIAFIVTLAFFTIASAGRMLSIYNLGKLIDQSMIIIVIGCGAIFVVAQGSIDLSVGVNLALSGVVSMWATLQIGAPILLIPISIIIGTIFGILNGFVVSKLKVPSFILTISLLIGVRGVVNFIQTKVDTSYIPDSLRILNEPYVKIPMFIVIILVMAYVFEYTKAGRYSQSIGENEIVAKFVGVPITKMKILAFMLSGMMAGMAAIFSIVTVGGTSQSMGSFAEMRVSIAIFLGGVLASGGKSARFYKMLLGAFSVTMIVNGLAIIGFPETQISQTVEGILLLLILFVTRLFTLHDRKRGLSATDDTSNDTDPEAGESANVS